MERLCTSGSTTATFWNHNAPIDNTHTQELAHTTRNTPHTLNSAVPSVNLGIFQDVRFHPTLNFGHFLGSLIFSMFLPHNELWPFLGPPSPLTFHNVKNHGGGGAEGEPGGIARNEEQKKTQKTTHRGKPRQTYVKQQRKTLGSGQTI